MPSNPFASSPEVEKRMKQQRRRDTSAELALRRELFRRGRRYRVDFHVSGKRRRVDIAFTKSMVAVFVDGCFWHRCPEHFTTPKVNRAWWIAKLEGNQTRDRETDQELRELGWAVVRVWEHESVGTAADRVEAILRCRADQAAAIPST